MLEAITFYTVYEKENQRNQLFTCIFSYKEFYINYIFI